MMDEMLRLEKVCVSQRGIKVLDHVRLNLRRGEILSVISAHRSDLSSLVHVLLGVQPLSSGYIFLNGRPVYIRSTADAARVGIYHVGKTSKIISSLSIAENLFSFNERSNFFISPRQYSKRCKMLCEKFNLDLCPEAIASKLDAFQAILLELLKAYVCNASVILISDIFSEYNPSRLNQLKHMLNLLASEGVSIILFSRNVETAKYMAERVSVIRDGINAGDFFSKSCDSQQLLHIVYGDKFKEIFQYSENTPSPVNLLECSYKTGHSNYPISFCMGRGETLGIFSIENNRENLAISDLFKRIKHNHMSFKLCGKAVCPRNISEAMDMGIVFFQDGIESLYLFNNLTIGQNLALCLDKKTLFPAKLAAHLQHEFTSQHSLPLETSVSELPILKKYELLLFKWHIMGPKLLVCLHPFTQIGDLAKSALYPQFLSLSQKGTGIILFTSNISEIVAMCDRVMVTHKDKSPMFFTNSQFRNLDIESLY